MARALSALGVHVEPVIADRRLPWRLEEGAYGFVFNIAEGQGRRCREAIPAAVCEMMGLPFTGSDVLTLTLTLDKALARRVVSRISTGPAMIAFSSARKSEEVETCLGLPSAERVR